MYLQLKYLGNMEVENENEPCCKNKLQSNLMKVAASRESWKGRSAAIAGDKKCEKVYWRMLSEKSKNRRKNHNTSWKGKMYI
jgi:hypothetical protein